MLQKPLTSQQFDLFIQAIKGWFCPQPEAQITSERLESLKRKYAVSIPEKIDLIKQLVEAVQQKPDLQHLTELREMVHKIGGSAGSYGFKEASTLCKDMDTQIHERIAARTFFDKVWLESLTPFLTKIEEAFTLSSQPTITAKTHTGFEQIPTIYVVDKDPKFLNALEASKREFQINLIVESNALKALEKIQQPDFNPDGIVAAQTFPTTSFTAFDIIRAQRQKLSQKHTVFAIILDQENIETRIEALQRGVSYIFRRPYTPISF